MIWTEEWAICGADYHSAGAGEEIGSPVQGLDPPSPGTVSEAESLIVGADAVLPRGAENAADRAVLETRPGKDKGCEKEGPCPGVRELALDSLWDLGQGTSLI